MINEFQDDQPLTIEQREFANKLSDSELSEVDTFILYHASSKWKKIAWLVGRSLIEFYERYPELPDVFYSERVRLLIKNKNFEFQGHLNNMRYCEVKIVNKI